MTVSRATWLKAVSWIFVMLSPKVTVLSLSQYMKVSSPMLVTLSDMEIDLRL